MGVVAMLGRVSLAYIFTTGLLLNATTLLAVQGYGSVEEEAEIVLKGCEATERMYTFYNCACFKEKFAERRREVGESESHDQIKFYVGNNELECKNADGVKKYKASGCKSTKFMLPPALMPRAEEYCDCLGEEFSKHYMDLKERFTQNQDRIFTMKATQTCKDRFGASVSK
jgi:hypothetical protein